MDLSVIVLSYNTKNITNECLSRLQSSVVSCQRKLKNKIEVIVLDNGSWDGSAEMIEEKHKWVNLIKSKTNTGYSKGNNIAFKKTKYPYVLLLNSDVYLEQDNLVDALKYFKDQSDLDVLGPKLVYKDGRFQPSAGNLPNSFNTICWILGLSLIPIIREFTNPLHPNYPKFFKSVREVGWITGAFFMIRRDVYLKAGGFDESIFMYMDEVEFCKRIKDLGGKIWYTPNISVTHLHSASSNEEGLVFIYELKGLKLYFNKYYKSYYSWVRLFLIIGLILRIIAFSLLGKTKRARAYLEGLSVI